MKVAFIGTDEIADVALRAVSESRHEIVLVITQPDRPRGRGRKIAPGIVKVTAEELGFPVMQPESIREARVKERLEETAPDILTVVSYGEYIPRSIYEAPPYRAINVHPSLLPRWRGAAPVRYALLAGDEVTGVTIQYIHKRMDAGDILLQEKVPIEPGDDHGSLSGKLHPIGARLLVTALDGLESSVISPVPQDPDNVTRAPKITKEDPWIDWTEPARQIRNRIRAFSPDIGARAKFRDKDCKILGVHPEISQLIESTEPGAIVEPTKEGPRVACSDGILTITRLQPAGKKALDGRSFVNGYRPEIGECFEGIRRGTEV